MTSQLHTIDLDDPGAMASVPPDAGGLRAVQEALNNLALAALVDQGQDVRPESLARVPDAVKRTLVGAGGELRRAIAAMTAAHDQPAADQILQRSRTRLDVKDHERLKQALESGEAEIDGGGESLGATTELIAELGLEESSHERSFPRDSP